MTKIKECPKLQILDNQEKTKIHQCSLRILEEIGIKLENAEALKLLKASGGSVSANSERVFLPEKIIQKCLTTVPQKILLFNRSGEPALNLESGQTYFGTGSDCIFTVDLETHQRRRATKRDVGQISRLCDSLQHIDFVMSMGNPVDVPSSQVYVSEFIEMVTNTIKPIVFTADGPEDIYKIWQIASIIAGGKEKLRKSPFLLNYSEPISPLLFPEKSMDKLLFCAEKGIPVAYIPSANAGGGGPVTLAGAIALANAETLAGLVLSQLKREGAPFLYGANVACLDMRDMVVSYGGPEWSLSVAAFSDMARFYGLPVWGFAGATDAKMVDAQAGAEAMLSIYTALLCGNTLTHDVGYLESGLTSSMEMILLADELIGMVKYVVKGIEVDENTLAFEAIKEVLPGKGFLGSVHTLNNWRTALYRPRLLDRKRHDSWLAEGGMDMFKRLNNEVKKIIKQHTPNPLPPKVKDKINR